MEGPSTRLRLDPWPAEYDSAIQFESIETEPSAAVDPNIETADWRAIEGQPHAGHWDICFVDGVRRVEARVLAELSEGRIAHGLFGSAAVGCVRCRGRMAAVESVVVRRFLILGCGLDQAAVIQAGDLPLAFDALSTPLNSPQELVGELQNQMRTQEAILGERLVASDARVFVDGPLTYFSAARQEIVGVIKSIYVPYLAAAQFPLVQTLKTGFRTPLFAILDGKNDRCSWFLRVAEGRQIDHPLAGIVRLEVRAAVGLDKARELADFSAAELPRFASTSARDPRAPQNLLPVGALEEELRRRLGDPLLLRRGIERNLMEAAAV